MRASMNARKYIARKVLVKLFVDKNVGQCRTTSFIGMIKIFSYHYSNINLIMPPLDQSTDRLFFALPLVGYFLERNVLVFVRPTSSQ